MNAPDPWSAFAKVFAEELKLSPLTPEEIAALNDEYQREAIAEAQASRPEDEATEDMG